MLLRLMRLRPRQSLVRWAIIGFFVATALILFVNEIAIWSTSRRLANRLESLRTAGEPTSPEEFLGPPIPESQNAAVPLDRAATMAGAFEKALFPRFGNVDPSELPNREKWKALASLVDASPEYEALLAEADRKQDYRSPVVFADNIFDTSLAHIQSRRSVARVEATRSRLLLLDGRADDACRLLLRQLRLTRKWIPKEPFLISAFAGIGMRMTALAEINRCVQKARISHETHLLIEQELSEEQSIRQALKRGAASERIWGVRMHRMSKLAYLQNRFLTAWANSDVSTYLDLVDETVASLERPRATTMEIAYRLVRNSKSIWFRVAAPGTEEMMFGPAQLRMVLDRDIARCRCLRIINECRSRGLSNPRLADVQLPEEAKTDPFNGEPLRLKVVPGGMLVYSVDENLKDDGGDFTSRTSRDEGFGP